MMVWDVFPYWRERWAAEARQRLWADVDSYTALALVGDRTHRGDMLPEWPDPHVDGQRVHRVILDSESDWGREAQQRDAVLQIRSWLDPDDLILLTDADELVDPRALPAIESATALGPVKLRMAHYMAGTRWRHRDWWRHAAACRARDLPEHPTADLRLNFGVIPRVPNAGWHLTYFGTDADVDAKLSAFAHAEMDTDQVREDIAQLRLEGHRDFVDDPLTGPLADILAGVAA